MRVVVVIACAFSALACAEQPQPPPEDERVAPSLEPAEVEPAQLEPAVVAEPSPEAAHAEAIRARHEDPGRAARLFEQACDQGLAASCVALADMLEAGEGIAADPDRARGVLEQSCAAGSTEACDRLGH